MKVSARADNVETINVTISATANIAEWREIQKALKMGPNPNYSLWWCIEDTINKLTTTFDAQLADR